MQQPLRTIQLRVNLFQRQSLRLHNQEVTDNRDDDVHSAPEHQRAILDIRNHVRVRKRVDKAEKPLTRHANRDTRFSDADWEDLGHVWPREWTPAHVVDDDEEVDEGYSRFTAMGYVCRACAGWVRVVHGTIHEKDDPLGRVQ